MDVVGGVMLTDGWRASNISGIDDLAVRDAVEHCCRVGRMAGETTHGIGQDGVARARTWLEKTGRVAVNFTVYEVGTAPFLTFSNTTGGKFSFDMGGLLNLDEGKALFYGEVKKYSSVGSQPEAYTEYLAKCYRATTVHGRPYHFIWITWHPFSLMKWSQLCTAEEIRDAVDLHKTTYCGDDQDIDEDLCNDLADRLWLIVLSDRQEGLSMSNEMLGELRKAVVQGVAP